MVTTELPQGTDRRRGDRERRDGHVEVGRAPGYKRSRRDRDRALSLAPGGTTSSTCVSESMTGTFQTSAFPNFAQPWGGMLRKPTPVTMIVSPTCPLPGLKPVIASGIVKFEPLVPVPIPVVTAIFPVVAPGGTVAFT